jgi:phosphatidylinositol-3-phosphatase
MKTPCLLLLALLAVTAGAQQLPHPNHIVIVIEENKAFGDVIGSPNAQYLNSLLPQGALLTNFHALHHPSQPNYLELFSGSNQAVCNDDCPPPGSITAPNLARSLFAAGKTFVGFAEDLPADRTKCKQGNYARKHVPWLDFTSIPLTATKNTFPSNAVGFAGLPTVSFVIPNLVNDMHNTAGGGHDRATEIRNGDRWLKEHLDAYRLWAMTHNSLLIGTWDEDSVSVSPPAACPGINTAPSQNRIATIIVGEHVRPASTSGTRYDLSSLLRTIEDIYGLPRLGASASAAPITDIWQ